VQSKDRDRLRLRGGLHLGNAAKAALGVRELCRRRTYPVECHFPVHAALDSNLIAGCCHARARRTDWLNPDKSAGRTAKFTGNYAEGVSVTCSDSSDWAVCGQLRSRKAQNIAAMPKTIQVPSVRRRSAKSKRA
jgi:hypothetical protein